MNSRILEAYSKIIEQNDENDVIPQDPYSISEIWETNLFESLGPDPFASPLFEKNGYKWKLIVYPNGYKNEIGKSLSIILMAIRLEEEHQISFKIQISSKESAVVESSFKFSKALNNRGFFSFIPLSNIMDYLTDGKLVFHINIDFSPPNYLRKHKNRDSYGFVGLKNQGATCYLNSILQCLYHTPAFRKIVYDMEIDNNEDPSKSIAINIQRLFTLMQLSPIPPSTYALTKSFGWSTLESFMQHDVQEFLRVLIDKLEEKMKETQFKNSIPSLFRGKVLTYIKCLNYEYTSQREEDFYDIQLVVRGVKNLSASLDKYVENDFLIDDNKYRVEGHGLEDAMKGQKFSYLPPIINIHLQRFEFSPITGGTVKVKDYFEFPYHLDMEPYLIEDEDHSKPHNYELYAVLVHQGEHFGGHYYAYIRPNSDRKWYVFNDEDVKEATEFEALNGNFGGYNKSHSAYFLSYVDNDRVSALFDLSNKDNIPQHLVSFYREWSAKKKGQKSGIPIEIYNEENITQAFNNYGFFNHNVSPKYVYEVPSDTMIKDILNELRIRGDVQSDQGSIWIIDSNGLIHNEIHPQNRVSEVFKNYKKVLVTNKVPNGDNRIPIMVISYDSNARSPIQYQGIVLTTRDSSLLTISSQMFPNFSEISQYYWVTGRDKARLISHSDLVSSLKMPGILALQVSTNPDQTGNIIPVFQENQCIRYDYVLPEFRPKTLDKYFELVSSMGQIKCFEYSSQNNHFLIEMPLSNSIGLMIRTLRALLNVSPNDSIVLFNRESTTQASSLPIDLNTKATIREILSTNALSYYIVNDISQNSISNKVFFYSDLFNDHNEYIGSIILIMNKGFSAQDVIAKLKSKGSYSVHDELRLLVLSGSRIITIPDPTNPLDQWLQRKFRVEIVPKEQLNKSGSELIRVSISNDKSNPRDSTIGNPFIFHLINGEPFAESKQRLQSSSNIQDNILVFGYSNDVSSKYTVFKDEDIPSQVLNGPNSMIYLFVNKGERKQPIKKQGTGSIMIYN